MLQTTVAGEAAPTTCHLTETEKKFLKNTSLTRWATELINCLKTFTDFMYCVKSVSGREDQYAQWEMYEEIK